MNQPEPVHNEPLANEIEQMVLSLMKIVSPAVVARNAEQLSKIERDITAATDAIAGRLIRSVIEQSAQDEQLNNQSVQLTKQSPRRMKNHGKREVTIYPYRGESFTIETAYFSKAGLSKQKAKKKESIHF